MTGNGKRMTKAEAGRLGGRATKANHDSDYFSRIGRKGGAAVVERYGEHYMAKIGRVGGENCQVKYVVMAGHPWSREAAPVAQEGSGGWPGYDMVGEEDSIRCHQCGCLPDHGDCGSRDPDAEYCDCRCECHERNARFDTREEEREYYRDIEELPF